MAASLMIANDCDMSKIIMLQVNPEFIETFEEAGLKFVGKDETGKRMEVRDSSQSSSGVKIKLLIAFQLFKVIK